MKVKNIVILLVIAMFLCTTCVFAAEPQISLQGDNTAKPGETKNISVKISAETEVGIVSGTISKNENISQITVTAKNNWNLTYNGETGLFNIYKAEGAKSEEIMNIQYTTTDTEGIGEITITDIEINTVEYETTTVDEITKEITIEEEQVPTVAELSSIEIVESPNKTTYKEGETFDPTGMEVEANYTDGSSKQITNYKYMPNGSLKTTDDKVIISYTEGEIIKTAEQEITVTSIEENEPEEDPEENNNQEQYDENEQEDDTTFKAEIPKAGTTQYMLIAVVAITIVSFAFYKVYSKNRDI